MVIAAGSVMNEPSSGPTVRMASHQAPGRPPPRRATTRNACSARRKTGRVEARHMMMTTNIASVKTTPWLT